MNRKRRWAAPLAMTMAAGLLVWGCSENADPGDSGESLAGDHAGGTENGGAAGSGGAAGAEGPIGGAGGSHAETGPVECKGSLVDFCARSFCPTSAGTFSKSLCSDQLRVVVESIEEWKAACGTPVVVLRDVDLDWYWYYFNAQDELVAVASGNDLGGCTYGEPPCELDLDQDGPATTWCEGRDLPIRGAGGQGGEGGQGGGTGQSMPMSCRYCELD